MYIDIYILHFTFALDICIHSSAETMVVQLHSPPCLERYIQLLCIVIHMNSIHCYKVLNKYFIQIKEKEKDKGKEKEKEKEKEKVKGKGKVKVKGKEEEKEKEKEKEKEEEKKKIFIDRREGE